MKCKIKCMDEICQILEIYYVCGFYKCIVKCLQVFKNIVKGYVQCVEVVFGIVVQVFVVKEGELYKVFFQFVVMAMFVREQAFDVQFGYWFEELGKVGVICYLLWQEYWCLYFDGYGYSQFCECFRCYLQFKGLFMFLLYKLGYVMYLDFVGKIMYWVSREDG